MGHRRTLSTFILSLAAACVDESASSSVPRILHGEDALTCQFPGVVALRTAEATTFCSGTLIHPRFVLSAAHCSQLEAATIAFGEDASAPERTVDVIACTQHPRWKSVGFDLQLCELAEPIDDVQIVPILMGCEQDLLMPGASMVVAGFGISGFGPDDEHLGVGTKRWVDVEFARASTQAPLIAALGVEPNAGTCGGDSGGPNFLRREDGSWRLVSVTVSSAIDLDFAPHRDSGDVPVGNMCPGGVTSVLLAPAMDWIEEVVGADVSPCFTANGDWDPGSACGPFPQQISRMTGTWAEGCQGRVGGEPMCPEAAGTSSGGTEGTGSQPDDSASDTDVALDSSAGDETHATGNTITGNTSSGTDTDTDPPSVNDGGGCSCRAGEGRTAWAFMACVLAWTRRRRR